MEETPEPKKRGWPKGKSRKPAPTFVAAPEPPGPINVTIRLKHYPEALTFDCARRTVENGFHVFFYPSRIDRYRETRREFAISEIIEIEITEARPQVAFEIPSQYGFGVTSEPAPSPQPRGPIIHSVKKHAAGVLSALETSDGPIKMDKMPNLTFGDHSG